MRTEFIPYELALRMKQLGFDEHKFAYYYLYKDKPLLETQGSYDFGTHSNSVSAPTFRQAFKFFRDKYGYLASPFSTESEEGKVIYYFEIGKINEFKVDYYSEDNYTYEEAELACLWKLIELCSKD